MFWIVIGLFLLFIIAFLAFHVRIVNQSQAVVVERLGAYQTTWGTGVHFLLPFMERVATTISLKEHVVDFDPQPVITKDNVTMQIDTVVFFRIYDAKLYAYGAVNPISALENLTATTLRNIVGELELDGTDKVFILHDLTTPQLTKQVRDGILARLEEKEAQA